MGNSASAPAGSYDSAAVLALVVRILNVVAAGAVPGQTPEQRVGAVTAKLEAEGLDPNAMSLVRAAQSGVLNWLRRRKAVGIGAGVGAGGQAGAVTVGAGDDECCGGYFGGAEAEPAKSLATYARSESAASKEAVIRAMATALAAAGIKVDAQAPVDEIIAKISAGLPDPRKGQSFRADAESQRQVCESLARLFNDQFTPGAAGAERLISGETPEVVCRQVWDVARSFMTGSHVEFLDTHISLRRTMAQLKLLTTALDAAERDIVGKISASGDPDLARKVDPVRVLYEQLRGLQRQSLLVLENLLDVKLPPVAKILAGYAEETDAESERIAGLIRRLGSADFGDGIAVALLGVGRAAAAAAAVDKALKETGLKLKQFNDSASIRDLRAAALELVRSDPARMADVLRSVNSLTEAFGLKADPAFQQALRDIGVSGAGESRGGAEGGGAFDAPPKSAISKRIQRVKDNEAILLKAFASDLHAAYREFLASINALVPKLGREIPLTENSDRLRDTVERLDALTSGNKQIEYALVGSYTDIDARERKQRFLSLLGLIASACADLQPRGEYSGAAGDLGRVKKATEAIAKVIDSYSKPMEGRVAAALGGADDDNSPPRLEVATEFASLSSCLAEAVRTFVYQYYVAKVRENLVQSSSELAGYGTSYEDILGDAVAAKLYEIERRRAEIVKSLKPSPALQVRSGVSRGSTWLPASEVVAAPTTQAQLDAHADVRKRVMAMFDEKVNFYRAIQAIDLYLKAFVRGVARDPESTRKIKEMLEGTQVIARWYSEITGNKIWRAFENCNTYGAAPRRGAAILTAIPEESSVHYYTEVGGNASAALGVPELGVRSTGDDTGQTAKMDALAKEAIDFFQGLKNLLNTFFRIGDEFGGVSLRSQIFMSPGQIYKALVGFLKTSAVEIYIPSAGDLLTASPMAFNAGNRVISDRNAVAICEAYFPGVNQVGRFFAEEDRYFAAVVKAIGAKILTTLGVYDMLERTTPLYDLTPTRMILGGAELALDPEPLAGAAELYFRLPRLAEFYREFLYWDGQTKSKTQTINSDVYRIAMLPELEGIFSGLIALVFVRASGALSGEYSESEMKIIISETNKIYEFYSAREPERPVKAALSAFVVEVNRRYGVVKQKEMKEYWDLVRLERGEQDSTRVNTTAFSILPGEGDTEVERKAPSDRFGVPQFQRFDPATGRPLNAEGMLSEPYQGRIGLQKEAEELLTKFRDSLAVAFGEERASFGKQTYFGFIEQGGSSIAAAADRSERQKAAYQLIQDSNLAQAGTNKILAFHETVVVGLNLLCAIETVIRQFSDALTAMNPVMLEGFILDAFELALQNRKKGLDGRREALVSAVGWGANQADLIRCIEATVVPTAAEKARLSRYLRSETQSFDGQHGTSPNCRTYDDVYTLINVTHGAMVGTDIRGVEDPTTHEDYPSEFFFAEACKDNFPPKKGEITAASRVDGAGAAVLCTARTVSRLLVNYPLIMEDFVEMLFALTSSGLVTLRYTQIDSAGIQLNFSGIQSLCEKIFASVRSMFETFRPHLPKDLIDRFEMRKNPGSIFWLEENLFDRRFRSGHFDASGPKNGETADGISSRANTLLKALTRNMNIDVSGFDSAVVAAAAVAGRPAVVAPFIANVLPTGGGTKAVPPDGTKEMYGTTFCGMVFWDASVGTTLVPPAGGGPGAGTGAGAGAGTGAGAGAGTGPAAPGPAGPGGAGPPAAPGAPGAPAAPAAPAAPGAPPPRYTTMGLGKTWAPAGLQGLIYPTQKQPGGGARNYPTNAQTCRLVPIWTASGPLGRNRSLLFALNQLIAQYLSSVIDHAGTGKVYTALIDGLANGVLSSAVSLAPGSMIPDFRADNDDTQCGIWGDPKPGVILLHSLACALQRLTRDTAGATPVPEHLVSTLTDVMPFMKERFRVDLPIFTALFGKLRDKCEFIKEFLQKIPTIDLARPNTLELAERATGAPGTPTETTLVASVWDTATRTQVFAEFSDRVQAPTHIDAMGGAGVHLAFHRLGVSDNVATRARINEIIGSVSAACYAAISSVEGVMRELGDRPKYFQTQEGAIENYRLRHGKDPLMPLSLSLSYLRNVKEVPPPAPVGPAASGAGYEFPLAQTGKPIGTAEFRMMYGHRGLVFGRGDVDLESLPWVATLTGPLGASLGPGSPLPAAGIWDLAKSAIGALRWLVDLRGISSQIAKCDVLPIGARTGDEITLFGTPADGLQPKPAPSPNTAYAISAAQLDIDATRILSVVESPNQADEMAKIVSSIWAGSLPGSGSRSVQRRMNLVDMNIVPINIHALMRDIPLANLYNFSHTFAEQVEAALGVGRVDPAARVDTTAKLMAGLIRDPFREVTDDEYGIEGVTTDAKLSVVQRMFRGEGGMGLGRPRFLSDQLFNKALLGSIYPSSRSADEAGPMGGPRSMDGTSRGRFMNALAAIHAARQALAGVRAMDLFRGAVSDVDVARQLNAIDTSGTQKDILRQISEFMLGGTNGRLDSGSWVDYHFINLDYAWSGFWRLATAAQRGPVAAVHNLMVAVKNALPALMALSVNDRVEDGGGTPNQVNAVFTDVFAPLLFLFVATRSPVVAINAHAHATVWGTEVASAVPRAVLTYMEDLDESRMVKEVVLRQSPEDQELLSWIGKARFDTTFVRKLILISNVQRLVRQGLNRALTHDRSVLLASHASVAPGVTEYGFDPFTPNEVSDSRPLGLNLGVVRDPATGAWPADSPGRWLDGR